jgi:hypothetical protein
VDLRLRFIEEHLWNLRFLGGNRVEMVPSRNLRFLEEHLLNLRFLEEHLWNLRFLGGNRVEMVPSRNRCLRGPQAPVLRGTPVEPPVLRGKPRGTSGS